MVIQTAKEPGIDIHKAENAKDEEFDGKFRNDDFELDIEEEETDN